ncbi:MAG: hypothetical protein AB7O96_15895 [Pseudobdellovibrionaceae bacterium]
MKMGSDFAFVYVPLYDERHASSIQMRMDLNLFGDLPPFIFGIANEALFSNMPDEEIQSFFYNQNHMNIHAATQFTKLIAPQIIGYFNEHIEKR